MMRLNFVIFIFITFSCSESKNNDIKNDREQQAKELISENNCNERLDKSMSFYDKEITIKNISNHGDIEVRKIIFRDSNTNVYESVATFDLEKDKYLDEIVTKTVNIKKNIMFSEISYFENKTIFGIFRFNSKRKRIDMFPSLCDTTGQIDKMTFFSIDSLGFFIEQKKYYNSFKESCKKYW